MIKFNSSPQPTIGVEIELQLVEPAFDSLGSTKYIKTMEKILNQDSGSTKQGKLYNSSNDFNYMLKSLKELFYQ